MALAYRAYGQLKPAVRARVRALLVRNPAYSRWTLLVAPRVSDEERAARLFAIASTWADQIKDDPAYSDDGTDNGNRPAGPSASQNVGYRDLLRHKYWHFINRPFSRDAAPLPAVPDPNAASRIRLFRSVLASDAPDDLKSYDLVWLLHLIGDVHQPLHCATRVGAGFPNGDAGGNFVSVCAPGCAMTQTLHSFWDTALGGGFSINDAVRAARELPPPDAEAASILDESVWVQESFQLAQQQAYRPPIGTGGGPFPLTPAYFTEALSLARRQTSVAAARLANVLNRELR